MRSILVPAVASIALFVVVGCGSEGGSDSASGANADVCTQFAAAHDELTALALAGPASADGLDAWTLDKDAAIAKFGPLAEGAGGEVKASIESLVGAMPADSLELTEVDSASGQAFVDNSDAVASACESDGTTITLADFPLQKF